MPYVSVSVPSGHPPRNSPYFVTFRKGRDLHFSSGLIDSLYLQPGSWWKVGVDRRKHTLRLSQPANKRPDKSAWVKMIRAGRTTKQGRPKVLVRCTWLFRTLNVSDEKVRSDVAIESSSEGKAMVFKYSIKGVGDD